jgi:hypothetical protein
MFDNGAIREFYSLLRAAMMGARKAGLLHRLINNQTLPSILAKMPPNDWRQWARERPTWMREAIKEAFWAFVDQKWRDALNVAAVEPAGWGAGSGGAGSGGGVAHEPDKRGPAEAARKLAHAAMHVAAAEGRPPQAGEGGRRCIFADVLRCTGRHPPWRCGRFGNIQAEERAKIIGYNQLYAFCLLHDRAIMCRAKENQDRPACSIPECEGRHAMQLQELLKDIYGEKSRVHLVQGDDRWEKSEGAWVVDEVEEEDEMVLLNTVQQDGSSWQESDDSWLELNGGETAGVYCVGACHKEGGHMPGTKAGQPYETLYLSEEEGAAEAGWWSPDPMELQPDEGETEYLIDLLMRGSGAGRDVAEPARTQAAPNVQSHPTGGKEATGKKDQPEGISQETSCQWTRSRKRGRPKDRGRTARRPPGGSRPRAA